MPVQLSKKSHARGATPARASIRTQRFRVRAVTHGMEYWTCPWCGGKNATRLSQDNSVLDCTSSVRKEGSSVDTHSACGGRFYAGRKLYPVTPGKQRPPADWAVPGGNELRESFPLGELNRDPWRAGDRMHAVYIDPMRAELDIIARFVDRLNLKLLGVQAVGVELARMEAVLEAAENSVAPKG